MKAFDRESRNEKIIGTRLVQESDDKREVRIYQDPAQVAEQASVLFAEQAKIAVGERGRFEVLLSGGQTPIPMFERLANLDLPWERVQFFWGDERVVPPESSESNYGTFKKSFLERCRVPPENIHRVPTELLSPNKIAETYEYDLRFEFGHVAWPRFDLAIQGIGTDGHTASLFPGSSYEHDSPHWIIAPYVEKLGSFRISVSLGVLNAARSVLFLATGPGKAEVIHHVLKEPITHIGLLPSQRVMPKNGKVFWFLDRAAASRL
jgi:6-phosphogluconolactonase